MNKVGKWLLQAAIILSIGASGIASATNGYFIHGKGTKNKGMAGAGMALPEDAVATTNNPAVAVLVGDSMELGIAVFNPNRSYRTTPSQLNGMFNTVTIGPNDMDSNSSYFPIPHFAKSWQRDDETAMAVAFYAHGGMNTDWLGGTATFDPDGPGPAPITTLPGTFGTGKTGVDLSQAFLDVTWAKKLNDKVSVGVTAIGAIASFKANGVAAFAPFTEAFAASGGSAQIQNLSNNGHSTALGYGARFGVHSQLNEKVSMGLSYQTKIFMSDFKEYRDLFAEQGDMDIPPSLKFGVSFQANDALALSFDVEHTWFSEVDAVGNGIALIFNCPTSPTGGTELSNCLGGDKGAGFGWEDMTTYKIGAQWAANDSLDLRVGFSSGDQPIPTSEMTFNILAPGVIEQHFTFGMTKTLESGNQLNFAFMYAPEETVTGPQNFDPTQMVTFEMDQFELEFSYGWKF
jgi:long-chain fatty acid transport protein